MKKKLSIGLAVASPILALGACQGGLGGAEHLAGQRGALIAEAAEGSTVCVDKNASFGCEAGEPSAVVDDEGTYDLDTLFSQGDSYEDATVIAVLKGTESDLQKASTRLAAAPGRPELISGATNLVYHLATGKDGLSSDEAWERVKERFGLDDTVSLSAEAHAPNSRLGRLSGYLESYVRTSGESAKSAEDQASAIRAVLKSGADVKAFLASLDAPAQPSTLRPFIAGSATPEGPVASDNYTDMAFTQGMRFGAGWNDVQSNVIGNTQCLEPYTITSNNRFSSAFRLTRLEDKHDLTDQLNISGKVVLDLGTFNATVEGQFFNLMQLNENYVYLLARNEVTLRDFHIQNAVMSLDGYGNCDPGLEDAEGRCPGVDGAPGLLNNRNGTRLGTIREKFTRTTDKEAFRDKCGDRYVNTITTGGSYYSMLVIKTSSKQEQEKLSATLDAKIKESLTVNGQMEYLFNELRAKTNVDIVIMQRGVGSGSAVVVTPEQFDADLAAWRTSVCSVHGPNTCTVTETPVPADDWTKAPYRVKFEDYAGTANTPRGGDASADAAAMDVFVYLTNEYRDVRNDIENMLAMPLFFNGVSGREQELQDRIADINSQLAIVRGFYNQCNRTLARTCVDLNDDNVKHARGLKTPVELRKADSARGWGDLPAVKTRFPRTCAQFKSYFPVITKALGDHNHMLYMNGNKEKPFFMYCDGMLGDAPPVDYLTLEHYSAAGHDAQDNYSRFVNYPGTDGLPQTLTTVYDRLKVVVNADSLKVDVANQTKFRTSTGGPLRDPATQEMYTDAPFATAKSCDAVLPGSANINLMDTPFAVKSTIGFGVPDKQIELVTSPKTWYAAKTDAEARGGRLVVVTNENENTNLLAMLEEANYVEAWLGLRATTTTPREFKWADGTSNYRNFSMGNAVDTWINTFPQSRGDYCSVATSPNGTWEPVACRTQARPYFVQYRKTLGEGVETEESAGTRQVFDMSVKSQLGCGSVTPTVQLTLDYVPELFDPDLEPTH